MEGQAESKQETIKENLSALETIEQKGKPIYLAEKSVGNEAHVSHIAPRGGRGNCGAKVPFPI